jgi:hypothetical protein
MLMTKAESNDASRKWAANTRSPLDRDTQIEIMKNAECRHNLLMEKYKSMFYNER